ncbi:MAG: leucine-rich repeat protein [Kiritimatiellae bacterium]|nr:leucine-rich repeat protein [Kiritimatiellia bacterium]
MKAVKLVVLLATALVGAVVFGKTNGGSYTNDAGLVWTYKYESGTDKATLTAVARADGNALSGALVIPASLEGKSVVTIGERFCAGTDIESLTIASTVTTIEKGAFAECTSLVSVDMGGGVETIGGGTSSSYIADYDNYSDYGAFGGCINLKTVTFSSRLLSIGDHSFSECQALETLVLPDSLQRIGVQCFYHANALASVTFGTKLETIGNSAFSDCPELQRVVFSDCNTPLLAIGDLAFSSDVKLKTLTFSGLLVSIGERAFSGCTALTELSLPDSLTTISGGAFSKCTSLATLDMGNGLTTIGGGTSSTYIDDYDLYSDYGAFGGCINLKSIKFSSKLQSIGNHSFSECQALETLAFPDSLQYIGVQCFYHALDLSEVSFGTGLRIIGVWSFASCPELRKVSFSNSETPQLYINESAFRNDTSLAELTFSNSLVSIGEKAFSACTSLPSLVLPDTLITISGGAFSKCTSLVTLDMGNGVTTIGDGTSSTYIDDYDLYSDYGAFGGCVKLKSVKFSNRLQSIGNHSFSECWVLESITLPDTLQTIGVQCFYHANALKSVSFGTALESIDSYAFSSCRELQSVVFRECATPLLAIGNFAFSADVKLRTLTFSESLVSIGQKAFSGCTALTALSLPDSLTTIAGGAFAECTSLVSLDMGNGVTAIGGGTSSTYISDYDNYSDYGAFGGCISLASVKFSNRLQSIGNHSFSECQALESATFPESLQTIGIQCFYHANSLARVSFGTKMKLIDAYAFSSCAGLREVVFAPSEIPLLTISAYAFSNDPLLAKVSLSGALSSLEANAFKGDSLLRKLTVPSTVWTVGNNAFSSMGSLREVTFGGLPPTGLESSGLSVDAAIRYNKEYAEDWTEVIATYGYTNAVAIDWDDAGGEGGGEGGGYSMDPRYALASTPGDRAIASVSVSADTALNAFVLVDGKVYDTVLYVKNTADVDVVLALPSGFAYRALKGTTPLTVPAGTENILTITRIEDNTFLVSREELAAIQ